MIKNFKKLYLEENLCFRDFMVYLLLPFNCFFTFNISIIQFCYFSFFQLVGKRSTERTQSNQTVKEIRNKVEPFIPTHEWQDVKEGQPIRHQVFMCEWICRQVNLKLDWSAMNQKMVKLQMVKHYQVIESGLEREKV